MGKPDVTDQLCAFGRMLLDETLSRNNQLESKATAVIGFSGAILAFLVTQARSWLVDLSPFEQIIMGCVVASAFAATVAAFLALLISRFAWFSDAQWFQTEGGVLEDADRLKRFHLLAIHSINRKFETANDLKAGRVAFAQRMLALATIGLAAALAIRLTNAL
jgi:hypothetical protein